MVTTTLASNGVGFSGLHENDIARVDVDARVLTSPHD